MQNERIFTCLLAVFIFISLVIIVLLVNQNKNISEILGSTETLTVDDEAPVFEKETINGKKINIKDSNSLLVFFNTTCKSCEKSLPYVINAYDEITNKGIKVIGIFSANQLITRKYIKKFNIKFPIIADPDEEIFSQYKVHYVPLAVLINKNKKILYYKSYGVDIRKALSDIKSIINNLII